jgi:hypothetical protein
MFLVLLLALGAQILVVEEVVGFTLVVLEQVVDLELLLFLIQLLLNNILLTKTYFKKN